LNGVKVIDLEKDKVTSLNYYAPRCWLFGLLSSLLTNLYKLQSEHNAKEIKNKLLRMSMDEHHSLAERINSLDQYTCTRIITHLCDRGARQLVLDTLQDLVDTIIPISMMGVIDIDAMWVGMAGMFTSILGGMSVYQKQK
jgi:peroxisomal biogenesis factor 11 (PEX11)